MLKIKLPRKKKKVKKREIKEVVSMIFPEIKTMNETMKEQGVI